MKKLTKILAVFLAVLMLAPTLGVPRAEGASYCDHERDTSVPLDYRHFGTGDTDIDTYAKCKKCGEWYLYCGSREHNWQQAEVMNETCTTDGYYTVRCTICDASFTHITYKATGHSWSSWSRTKEPTCTLAGEQMRECSQCHQKETQMISALGHQWSEWKMTLEPTPAEDGVEQRECQRCHEKQTQYIPRTGIYARIGESAFEVLIAKQLAANDGKYQGEIDELMDKELSDALKIYQGTYGLEQNGDLTVDILEIMTLVYAQNYRGYMPNDGVLDRFSSGLCADAVFDDTYTSNGDGTHERTSQLTGIRFSLGQKESVVSLRATSLVDIICGPVHESCHVGNDSYKCECGYTEYKVILLPEFVGLLQGGGMIVTYDWPPKDDASLPEITGFDYEPVSASYVFWDELPGADHYYVWLERENEDQTDWTMIDESRRCDDPLFSIPYYYEMGMYRATVQAYNASDEPVSKHTLLIFYRSGTQAMAPEIVRLYYNYLSWSVPSSMEFIPENIYYQVTLRAVDSDWEVTHTTVENHYDFTSDIAEADFEPGTKLIATVQTISNKENVLASATVESNPQIWTMATFYCATSAVNIRSGPGKEYERVGGLAKGDIVTCFGKSVGEDGVTYLQIGYKGDLYYVNSFYLQWFQPEKKIIEVDLGNGITIQVSTDIAGNIDMDDFNTQIEDPKNGRIGYQLLGFKNITPDRSKLGCTWQKSPYFVFVNFHYPDNHVEEVPIRIGSTYDVSNSVKDHLWTTYPDGEGIIVTSGTVFTKSMTDLYSSPFKKTDIALDYTADDQPYAVVQLYQKDGWENSAVSLGALRAGDQLRIDSYYGGDLYEVYSYRLDRTGLVMGRLLSRASSAFKVIHFDANGGVAPYTTATAIHERSASGSVYRLKAYPMAVRDGYALVGWMDEDGVYYYPGMVITKVQTYLKAVWERHAPVIQRPAVIFDDDCNPVKYYSTAKGMDPENTIAHGKEVVVVGESDERYECLYGSKRIWVPRENIAFYRFMLWGDDEYDYYLTSEAKIAVKGPKNYCKFYVIGEGTRLFHAVSPDFTEESDYWIDVRNDPDLKYNDLQVFFDAGPGSCTVQSIHLIDGQNARGDMNSSGAYCRLSEEYFPMAYLPGYKFLGWYTEPIGGYPVDAYTPIYYRDDGTPHTFYAHYEGLYDDRIYVTQTYARINALDENGELEWTDEKIPTGTILIEKQRIEDGTYLLVRYDGRDVWVRRGDLIKGDLMTVTHVEYKTDRYIRSKPTTRKGKKYEQVHGGQTFVVVDEEDGYYKVVYEGGESNFAYLSKRHFK
ncbi:MAG: SH3 domain-containing protein [Firmicutes bacterium]|nr:SH3 domain-containing protein [Bacillota bacterium]